MAKNITIQFGSNFGNFRWDAEAEIDLSNEALVKAVLENGALQIDQRSPSTAAEKEMAGYEKRPKGFQRTSIPFSESDAKTLAKHLENLVVQVSEEESVTIPCLVTVKEYEGAGTSESKFTAERAKYVQRKDTLGKLAKAVGYDGELGDGSAENAPMDFLKAIRTWVRAQAEQL